MWLVNNIIFWRFSSQILLSSIYLVIRVLVSGTGGTLWRRLCLLSKTTQVLWREGVRTLHQTIQGCSEHTSTCFGKIYEDSRVPFRIFHSTHDLPMSQVLSVCVRGCVGGCALLLDWLIDQLNKFTDFLLCDTGLGIGFTLPSAWPWRETDFVTDCHPTAWWLFQWGRVLTELGGSYKTGSSEASEEGLPLQGTSEFSLAG